MKNSWLGKNTCKLDHEIWSNSISQDRIKDAVVTNDFYTLSM